MSGIKFTLLAEGDKPIEMRAFNGKVFLVRGYEWSDESRTDKVCPVDKCGSLCCKVQAVFPVNGHKGGGSCKELQADGLCGFEKAGGHVTKPHICYMYPMSQAAVDRINEHAEGDVRCYLTVEQVDRP